MILCVGTTPAVQRVMVFGKLRLDAVNRARLTLDGAAGKSINVAKVLQALGERPVATGFLGGDRGEYLRAELNAKGIEHEFLTVAARTRQCVTVIDEAAGTVTELVEESRAVDPADAGKLISLIQQRIKGCHAFVMSGTIAPGVPVDLYFRCTRLACEAGALSLLDAHGPPLLEALEAQPGLVKPNRSELAATLGRELNNDTTVVRAMRELCERGAQRVVVTAGKEPTLAFDGHCLWRIVGPTIKATNPIGSGDAFTAGLVWRLGRGEDLGEAGRWASAIGAANALTPMAGEVNLQDVERLVRQVTAERI